ncbi:ArnT family glycosyltransferase [Sphingomonas sp. ID0503]|uniref:ArnT family glycosyltransferase n=1 Tax=Sphingomonas sp. ID0503 TaxID=3399691 RepID=UPI003AFA9D38
MSETMRQDRWRPFLIALLGLLAVAILARAVFAPENHDEAQYVASAVLTADGWLIFRDFMSLQAPVHALVFAPIARLFPHDVYLAMRLATALCGFGVLAVVWATLSRMRVSPAAALLGVIGLGGCAAFQFSGSIVRNDMLATLFLAGAIWGLLARRNWALFGLFVGLAVATKLSFAPYLLASGTLLIRQSGRNVLRFAGGTAVGLAPLVICTAVARHEAWYGMVEFGAVAPFHWYGANGMGAKIGVLAKVLDTLESAVQGPALLAALVVAVKGRRGGFEGHALRVLTFAGLLGALIPTPTHLPYLMPLLPPLFILFAMTVDRMPAGATRRWVVALALLLVTAGSVKSVKILVRAPAPKGNALTITSQTQWIAATIRAHGLSGPIVTLSPHRAAGAGLILDRRFATGPFVYRSGVLLSPERAKRLAVATPATLDKQLDAAPPAAILTGYEGRSRKFTIDPDRTLIAYAQAHNYRPVALPDGLGTLHLRPARR